MGADWLADASWNSVRPTLLKSVNMRVKKLRRRWGHGVTSRHEEDNGRKDDPLEAGPGLGRGRMPRMDLREPSGNWQTGLLCWAGRSLSPADFHVVPSAPSCALRTCCWENPFLAGPQRDLMDAKAPLPRQVLFALKAVRGRLGYCHSSVNPTPPGQPVALSHRILSTNLKMRAICCI